MTNVNMSVLEAGDLLLVGAGNGSGGIVVQFALVQRQLTATEAANASVDLPAVYALFLGYSGNPEWEWSWPLTPPSSSSGQQQILDNMHGSYRVLAHFSAAQTSEDLFTSTIPIAYGNF